MHSPIRAFLFDLGNVLIYFSHERMYRQMAEVAGMTSESVFAALDDDRLQWRYESGLATSADLLQGLRARASLSFTDAAMLTAASDIFEPNEAMLPVLASLKRAGHRLVIVSNTNEAHMAFAMPRFACFEHFDAKIFSHEIRAAKPDPAFYEAALAAAGCPREACLFIDDLPVNIEGAKRFGFQGVVFTGADQLLDELRARGVTLP